MRALSRPPRIRREEVNRMEVNIKGDPKEFAALVLAVQARRELDLPDDESIKALAQAIYDRQQGLQGQSDS